MTNVNVKDGGLRKYGIVKQSYHHQPLVTVITVVFNGESGLESTIRSIINQRYNNIEYIIIDGGSTDNTINILHKYDNYIDYWLSEPDKGVYDAMNKGISLATGDFIININIGDLLIDVPVEELIDSAQEKIDIVSFNVALTNNNIFRPRNGFIRKIDNFLHHQGTFYSTKIEERYDPKYKVFADFDLNQRLDKKKCRIATYDKVVSFHSIDGLSHYKKYFGEVWQIIRSNYGTGWVAISFLYFKCKGLWYRIKS